jgi:GT2 family glycosyltransferase
MSERGAGEVTIVVSPRERFSLAIASLESIVRHTRESHELIYVDGNSPRQVQAGIAEIADEHGYRVIRTNQYLPPNHARNLALPHIRTRYVVFIDNDVFVTPGWLSALIDCAEATGAAVISPLICQGSPIHEIVHCAGGRCGISTASNDNNYMFEKIRDQGKKVSERNYRREPTGLAEFHCMLVRASVLKEIGELDENLLNTREHIDFCIEASKRGGSIWFEPASVVTYLNDAPLKLSDIHYYMLRWGDDWERRSLTHIAEKWNLHTDGALGNRLRNVGARRRYRLVHPAAKIASLGIRHPAVRQPVLKALLAVETKINAILNERHRRNYDARC